MSDVPILRAADLLADLAATCVTTVAAIHEGLDVTSARNRLIHMQDLLVLAFEQLPDPPCPHPHKERPPRKGAGTDDGANQANEEEEAEAPVS